MLCLKSLMILDKTLTLRSNDFTQSTLFLRASVFLLSPFYIVKIFVKRRGNPFVNAADARVISFIRVQAHLRPMPS